MNWYYAESGKQIGPITEEQLSELVKSGRIKLDTLVWREGMANWQPYLEIQAGAAKSLAPSLPTPSSGGKVVCRECGRIFSPEDVIRYGESWVCLDCKPNVLRELQASTELAGTTKYAGFWIRVAAKLLDGIIVGTAAFLIFSQWGMPSMASLSDMKSLLRAMNQLEYVTLLVSLPYTIFFLGKYGATPGKMALKIRVVRSDGAKLTYARAAGRFFAEILSGLICNIGYIIAAFDGEKRALHDHICDTRVVRNSFG